MVISIVFFVLRLYFRIFHSIKISGLEKIPAWGPLIIVANHVSNADPAALSAHAGLVRKISILAKKELFYIPPLGAMLKSWGAIPVDRRRGGGDLGAFRAALKALKGGACLVIFPEGTRAKPGRPLEPKLGAAMLAAKSGAPVLCARIFNTENFLKLGKITIKFGNMRHFEPAAQAAPPTAGKGTGEADGVISTPPLPQPLSAVAGANPKESYKEFSKSLMSDIFSIKEYGHGDK